MERKLLAVVLAVAVSAAFSAGMYLNEVLHGGGKAEFKVENLRVTSPSPYEELYGRSTIAISVDVSNVGSLSGVKQVSVRVDNETVAENTLSLVVGESKTFKTKIKPEEKAHKTGTHNIRVGSLSSTYKVKKLPVKVSVGDIVFPGGTLCRCARRRTTRVDSPLLEVTVTNKGSENMAPFRIALKTPRGTVVGGVLARTKSGCSSACTRSNLQGETTYYVPVSSSLASPTPGKYELNVADYNVQGVWQDQISYSGSKPQVVKWGPIQFKPMGNGYVPTQGEVTVKNRGDLPLSVAGLKVSIGGENLNGVVSGSPFVLPQRERTFQLTFENHQSVQGGKRTAQFELLKWVRRGKTRGVVAVAEATREIEIE